MNKLISLLTSTLFLLMLFATAETFLPQQAQAQTEYTVADDYKLAWSLDPRDEPGLFARGLALD